MILRAALLLPKLLLLLGVSVSNVAAQQSLLGGRFQTTTDVQGILNLALDIRDMKDSATEALKLDIYQNGKNGPLVNGSPLSLASLSLEAGEVMNENPYYNIFRHAFLVLGNKNEGETMGMFDGNPIEEYGNTIVEDLFSLAVENIESDAAIVMNVWMVINHELFTVLDLCDGDNDNDALARLDRAVALWVGEEQVDGVNTKGHMMYNLAEIAGSRFGQDFGETKVNTDIITLFSEMQTFIGAGTCTSGYVAVRDQVRRAIRLMTIPLVQMMIHHTFNVSNEGGSNFVELYALALIPRIAACDPDAYANELKLNVLRELTADKSAESILALQASLSCLDVSCDDIGEYEGGVVQKCNDPITSYSMAGYTTTRSDARAKSYMDRDILQIDIFLKFRALDAAMDWYQYGWNSVYSLQELARNQVIPTTATEQFGDYTAFYMSPTFAHNWLMDIMEEQVTPYDNASFDQTRELATSILKYVVMYLASISSFQYAVTECEATNKISALNNWDAGVAFYIGSMEGGEVGGSEIFGQLLYSTSKELCDDFDTCLNPIGDSTIKNSVSNEVAMTGFIGGAAAIDQDTCSVARNILETQIIPNLAIPLFQGTLKNALINAGLQAKTTDGSLAVGYAFSRGILPLISSSPSALTIQSEMAFQLDTKPVPGGFSAVFDALRTSLPGMETACFDIGILQLQLDDNLCDLQGPQPTTPPPQATPQATPAPQQIQQPTTNAPSVAPIRSPVLHPYNDTPAALAFGRYIFSDPSIADGDGKFALDVRDMFTADSTADATNIYNTGVNALPTGLSGEMGGVSLASLSTEASAYMAHDPMFNIYKYALYTDVDFEDTAGEDFAFADDVVQEAISNGQDTKLAAEAAVVMNVWMVITHKLQSAVNLCKEGQAADRIIDSAVALWIGKEQAEGKFDNGWMMYSVGQSASKFFGMEEGEAPINTQLMMQFNEAQALAKTCGGNSEYIDLRVKVFELIRSLTKPLVMSLLFHMVHNNSNMVELYSVSVIPQCAGCNPRAHQALQDALYQGYDHTTDLTDDLMDHFGTFFRCMRITCDDLRVQGDASQALKDLVARICDRLSYPGLRPIVGYIPTSDVTEYSRFDVDILQVEIFMDTQAYKAAHDYYELGSNVWATNLGTKFISLKALATDGGRDVAPQYEIFREYFDSLDYADELIMDVINKIGDYNSASRGQRSSAVTTALINMVVYMAVLEKMYSAVRKCESDDLQGAAADWDKSVALLVGSMEGTIAGGLAGGDGYMMYAEANEQCLFFDTCEPSGEAKSNEELMSVVSSLKDSLTNSLCDNVKNRLSDDIFPSLTIPLVQGVLRFASSNQGISPAGDYDETGSANMMAYSVAPLVDSVNETSALLLDTSFDFGPAQVQKGTASVYAAFSYALRGMGINCEDIGLPVVNPSLTVCRDPTATGGSGDTPVAPPPDTPTKLGDNLYVTTTYVEDRAKIALDLKDMSEALNEGSTKLAQLIYTTGKNSEIFDDDGKFSALRNLRDFSTISTLEMVVEPTFNIFQYALQGPDRSFMGRDARLYADTLVNEAFTLTSPTSKNIPAEAALVLNLWMEVAHKIHNMLYLCKNKMIKGTDGVHTIDIVAAYWIGDSQVAGDGNSGHLLYALAERMGELFNMDVGGQSRTNTNIIRLLNQAKNEIMLPNTCSENPAAFGRLSQISNKIMSQMAIPLIQGLIHNLRANDRDRVKMYAHAYVPLVAGCDPSSFTYLHDKLINLSYNVIEVDEIVDNIRKTYSCLNLQCDDVGVHGSELTEGAKACDDPDVFSSLAGYRPSTDVRKYAKLDLDILEMDILLQMQAYSAAEDLYLYGKHVDGQDAGSLSLAHLATTSERSVVPQFDSFSRYYDADDYADTIIRGALSGTDTSLTDSQRRAIIVRSSQVLIMYFGALGAMYEAVSQCGTEASVRSGAVGSDSWDKGAALLIGSLEGAETGGSENGYMFYDLAQERCKQFGMCTDEMTDVEVNDQLIDLLYAGRGAMLGKSCNGLRKAADELASLLLVPVVQSALSAALQISDSGNSDQGLTKAEGYVYTQQLLPLVDDANRDAATTISNNLGLPGPSNYKNVAKEVFAALAKSYSRLAVDCTIVGEAGGYDACTGAGQDGGIDTKTIGLIVGAVLGLCLFCCCLYFMLSKKKVVEKLPENNPTFVTSDGELNHSMDLLQKAFSGNMRPPTETTGLTIGHNDASPIDDEDFDEATDSRERAPDII